MNDPNSNAILSVWADMPKRKSKEMSLAEAGKIIASKNSLSLAGSQMVNSPMALIRAGIRAGASGMTIIPAIDASMAVDVMIAAGMVDTLFVSYVGFETLGLAPAFRAAAENGTLNIIEADEPFIVHGTRAAAAGLPFIAVKHVYDGSVLPSLNPQIKTTTDPYTGETVYTIPALHSDICILHAQEVDQFGNAQLWAGNGQEMDKAKAAGTVIISAERIVSVDKSRVDPHKVTIPGYLVDGVVHAPFGAHPTMSAGFYNDDQVHMKAYSKAIRSGAGKNWLSQFVHGPKSNTEYLQEIGLDALTALMREVPADG